MLQLVHLRLAWRSQLVTIVVLLRRKWLWLSRFTSWTIRWRAIRFKKIFVSLIIRWLHCTLSTWQLKILLSLWIRSTSTFKCKILHLLIQFTQLFLHITYLSLPPVLISLFLLHHFPLTHHRIKSRGPCLSERVERLLLFGEDDWWGHLRFLVVGWSKGESVEVGRGLDVDRRLLVNFIVDFRGLLDHSSHTLQLAEPSKTFGRFSLLRLDHGAVDGSVLRDRIEVVIVGLLGGDKRWSLLVVGWRRRVVRLVVRRRQVVGVGIVRVRLHILLSAWILSRSPIH